MESSPYLRLLGAFGALVAGAAAVVVVALLVRGLPAATSSAQTGSFAAASGGTPASTPAASRPAAFPAPPRGSIAFAGKAGTDALGLGIVPGKGKVVGQASVIGELGAYVKGLSVRFDVRGRDGRTATAAAKPCGAGCYRATVGVAHPRAVHVLVGAHRVSFAMPAAWPPPAAGALVARAGRVWRGLHTLVIHDTFSDGSHTLVTLADRRARPDRLPHPRRQRLDHHRRPALGPALGR